MRYLDSTDNVFVSAELGGANMAVAGLMEIEGTVDQKRLEQALDEFSSGADRLRQRLDPGSGLFARPYWVPMGQEFDIGNHLAVRALPDSLAELYDDVGRLMETPLSYRIPLWHLTCYKSQHDHASSYLLFRISHLISDGQGLAQTLSMLLSDRTPSFLPEANAHKAGRQYHRRHTTSWPLKLFAYLMMVAVMLYNLVNTLFHSRRSLRAPKHAVRHQVGFNHGLKVSEVKELTKASGASFNDIVVSCAASAIERHLFACDKLHDSCQLYLIPTSLRAEGDATLSNQSSMFTLSVPVGVPPTTRLATVRRRMQRQKATLEPEVLYAMAKALFRWPKLMSPMTALTRYFNEVIVTNVPGPKSPSEYYLGDLHIVRMIPVVCLAHHNTIGIGVMSFGDDLAFSVHMKLDERGDQHAVYGHGNAQRIAEFMGDAFAELQQHVRAEALAIPGRVPNPSTEDKRHP